MTRTHPPFLFLIALATVSWGSDGIVSFPSLSSFEGTSTAEFRDFLFVGSQDKRTSVRGNLGRTVPLLGIESADTLRYGAGVAANVHLVMLPRAMTFAVDNFYATLALYLEATPPGIFSLRLFPVYHVSAHLADGHADDTALADARAVSSEMTRIEISCTPLPILLLSAGYGRYYHVCAQKPLTDLLDSRLRITLQPAPHWNATVSIGGHAVYRGHWDAGGEMEAGVFFRTHQHKGVGAYLRYFNATNSGYFYGQRDRGIGAVLELAP